MIFCIQINTDSTSIFKQQTAHFSVSICFFFPTEWVSKISNVKKQQQRIGTKRNMKN